MNPAQRRPLLRVDHEPATSEQRESKVDEDARDALVLVQAIASEVLSYADLDEIEFMDAVAARDFVRYVANGLDTAGFLGTSNEPIERRVVGGRGTHQSEARRALVLVRAIASELLSCADVDEIESMDAVSARGFVQYVANRLDTAGFLEPAGRLSLDMLECALFGTNFFPVRVGDGVDATIDGVPYAHLTAVGHTILINRVGTDSTAAERAQRVTELLQDRNAEAEAKRAHWPAMAERKRRMNPFVSRMDFDARSPGVPSDHWSLQAPGRDDIPSDADAGTAGDPATALKVLLGQLNARYPNRTTGRQDGIQLEGQRFALAITDDSQQHLGAKLPRLATLAATLRNDSRFERSEMLEPGFFNSNDAVYLRVFTREGPASEDATPWNLVLRMDEAGTPTFGGNPYAWTLYDPAWLPPGVPYDAKNPRHAAARAEWPDYARGAGTGTAEPDLFLARTPAPNGATDDDLGWYFDPLMPQRGAAYTGEWGAVPEITPASGPDRGRVHGLPLDVRDWSKGIAAPHADHGARGDTGDPAPAPSRWTPEERQAALNYLRGLPAPPDAWGRADVREVDAAADRYLAWVLRSLQRLGYPTVRAFQARMNEWRSASVVPENGRLGLETIDAFHDALARAASDDEVHGPGLPRSGDTGVLPDDTGDAPYAWALYTPGWRPMGVPFNPRDPRHAAARAAWPGEKTRPNLFLAFGCLKGSTGDQTGWYIDPARPEIGAYYSEALVDIPEITPASGPDRGRVHGLPLDPEDWTKGIEVAGKAGSYEEAGFPWVGVGLLALLGYILGRSTRAKDPEGEARREFRAAVAKGVTDQQLAEGGPKILTLLGGRAGCERVLSALEGTTTPDSLSDEHQHALYNVLSGTTPAGEPGDAARSIFKDIGGVAGARKLLAALYAGGPSTELTPLGRRIARVLAGKVSASGEAGSYEEIARPLREDAQAARELWARAKLALASSSAGRWLGLDPPPAPPAGDTGEPRPWRYEAAFGLLHEINAVWPNRSRAHDGIWESDEKRLPTGPGRAVFVGLTADPDRGLTGPDIRKILTIIEKDPRFLWCWVGDPGIYKVVLVVDQLANTTPWGVSPTPPARIAAGGDTGSPHRPGTSSGTLRLDI